MPKRCADFAPKYARTVGKNVQNMKRNTAKDVRKPARNVQMSAEKWLHNQQNLIKEKRANITEALFFLFQ